jgi:hypothetical protein
MKLSVDAFYVDHFVTQKNCVPTCYREVVLTATHANGLLQEPLKHIGHSVARLVEA